MAQLAKLLNELHLKLPAGVADCEVKAITSDSRQVKPGTLFVAVKGTQRDGHAFVETALRDGAVLTIGQDPHPDRERYVSVPSSAQALGVLASAFYGHPSRAMKMIGVTGTSGKTTTTYLIEAIYAAAGQKAGVIGTVNFRFGAQVIPSTHTTPGPVELQAILAQMRDAGCDVVVMEVSSHALKQARTAGLVFDGLVFNNLSAEHLDFHPDMEDYFQAKASLFKDYGPASAAAGKQVFAAINTEDAYGRRLHQEMQPVTAVRSFSFAASRAADFDGRGLHADLSGIRGTIVHAASRFEASIRSPLAGGFNAQNILGAVAITHALGVSSDAIARGVSTLPTVPGRMQRVPNDRGLHILVDYAHKPDALEKVLIALAGIKRQNRLITVFGCGGDRDRQKRPVMGQLAVTHSDLTIVTSDNPRTEKPEAIIAEIVRGIDALGTAAKPFRVEPDRERAIRAAVAEAKAGDLVLIAGKGHEDYQIIADPDSPSKTRKIHFDDLEVAAAAVSAIPS